MKPLAVDLCCGLGGWSEGLLAAGWDVCGFDVERHVYGSQRYPAQLVLQDICTLDGRQFRGKVSLIVASPPCQKYSYMAMPWTRAKALIAWYRDPAHPERIVELNGLFHVCFRIAREAECPIVLENVRGIQPWVGRAKWNFGSYYLFGDVPALMPMPHRAVKLGGGLSWAHPTDPKHTPGLNFTRLAGKQASEREGVKHHAPGPRENGKGSAWFGSGPAGHGSQSSARKAASAAIAKIPFALARHIAECYYPREVRA